MDLTIKFEDQNEVLNVRVAVIMETKNGLVLSHSKKGGYYFVIGGRAKLGESSIASAIREVYEETGIKLAAEDFKLISIIENFWETDHKMLDGKKWKVHEINFVFSVPKQEKIYEAMDGSEIVEIPKEESAKLDIRPEIIKKIILENKLQEFNHFIV